jgi:hypothetical protein
LTNGGRGALALWQDLVSDGPAGGVAGTHKGGEIWLHALLDAKSIADYLLRAKSFVPVGELKFRASAEVLRLKRLLDCSSEPCAGLTAGGRVAFPADPFVVALTFKQAELEVLARHANNLAAVARSCPISFSWHDLSFSVQVELSRTAEGRLAVSWSCLRFSGDILLEEMDYIAVGLAGAIVTPGSDLCEPMEFQLPSVTGPDGIFCGASTRNVLPSGRQFLEDLLSGVPLISLVHVSLQVAGHTIPVIPGTQCRTKMQ